MRIGVVLAGGASSQSSAEQVLPRVMSDAGAMADAYVVAADSGLDLARRLDIVPDVVVGDFDSVTLHAVDWAKQLGVEMRPSPADKDETDLDLALAAALDAGAERLIVLGGAGGRLDHLLGNVGAIARVAAERSVPTEAWLGTEYLAVVRPGETWTGVMPVGATVTVLPWRDVTVVSETGVRWPLDHHELPLGSTQGISNQAAPPDSDRAAVEITVHEGHALVIVPSGKDLT